MLMLVELATVQLRTEEEPDSMNAGVAAKIEIVGTAGAAIEIVTLFVTVPTELVAVST
jgi:hypothetical protein